MFISYHSSCLLICNYLKKKCIVYSVMFVTCSHLIYTECIYHNEHKYYQIIKTTTIIVDNSSTDIYLTIMYNMKKGLIRLTDGYNCRQYIVIYSWSILISLTKKMLMKTLYTRGHNLKLHRMKKSHMYICISTMINYITHFLFVI